MCPYSIYLGLKGVPIWVLKGLSIYYTTIYVHGASGFKGFRNSTPETLDLGASYGANTFVSNVGT